MPQITSSKFSSVVTPCIVKISHSAGSVQFAALFTRSVLKESGVKFTSGDKSINFNYDLKRMNSFLKSDEIPIPDGLNTAGELDNWLMGLNLE